MEKSHKWRQCKVTSGNFHVWDCTPQDFLRPFLCPELFVDSNATCVGCAGLDWNCLDLSVHFSPQCPFQLSLTLYSDLEFTRSCGSPGLAPMELAQGHMTRPWFLVSSLMALQNFCKITRNWTAQNGPQRLIGWTYILYIDRGPTGNLPGCSNILGQSWLYVHF